MYMTIQNMYDMLGDILREHKEVDRNALVTDCYVIEKDKGRRYPPGTIVFFCKDSDTHNSNLHNPYLKDFGHTLAIMPERISECLM